MTLCCKKTGVRVTRCKEVILTNPTTPKSLGLSEHETIFTGLLPLISEKESYQDNFDETGQQIYRTFCILLNENIFQTKKWQVMDILEFNDGQLMNNTLFDENKLKNRGKIYSIRELVNSPRLGKLREIKIRFDLQ
jgi:hypothetical protein